MKTPLFLLPLALLIALASTALTGQAPPGKPGPTLQIAFEETAVAASGLTPGRQVVWFGVEHRVDADYSGEMAQRYEVGTVAADGTARLDLGRAAAPRSLWAAGDLHRGDLPGAAPHGYRIARPQHLSHLGLGQGAKADELLDDRPFLMGLMVRPGTGAWAFTGGDGGPRDEAGKKHGHLTAAPDHFD